MKKSLRHRDGALKFLKISSKLVTPCLCPQYPKSTKPLQVHEYCITAKILMDRTIYCDKCQFQYNLFAKEGSICSGKALNLCLKYLIFMFLINLFAVSFLAADGLMKTRHAHSILSGDQNKPELMEKEEFLPSQQPVYPEEGRFDNYDSQDYTKEFSLTESVLWNVLLYVEGLVTVLMSWCFYFQTNRAIQSREKLIFIIVKDRLEVIPRTVSKRYLNLAIQMSNRKHKDNELFDSYWYEKRDELT